MEILCPICFDDLFSTNEELVDSTKCGHVFHHQCLLQWTKSSSTCPNCRQIVKIDDILKLNVHVNIEEPSIALSSMNKIVTRSSVRSPRTQRNVLLSELAQKNLELCKMEKKYNTSETENDKLRNENSELQKEINKLKRQLQIEKERNVIIRSDLRIMDIIDLEEDRSRDQFNEKRESTIDLTML